MQFQEKSRVSKFIANLNNNSSRLVNKLDKVNSRKVWFNYWDKVIRSEEDFYKHLNYIHHNPVKHKYALKMEDWPWSSHQWYLENKGQEWLDDCFAAYP